MLLKIFILHEASSLLEYESMQPPALKNFISLYVHMHISARSHHQQGQYIHQNSFNNLRYPTYFFLNYSYYPAVSFILINLTTRFLFLVITILFLFILYIYIFCISYYVSSFLVCFCSSHSFLLVSYWYSFVNVLFAIVFSNKMVDTRNSEAGRNKHQLIYGPKTTHRNRARKNIVRIHFFKMKTTKFLFQFERDK
jgi:hypothetical protein